MSAGPGPAARPGVNPPFDPQGAVVVVTGGASGIGRALARRAHVLGAAAVVLADLDADRTAEVAAHVAATSDAHGAVDPVALDVADPVATAALVDHVADRHGPIDLWCANAGIATGAGIDADLAAWDRMWNVNVLGALHAARALVPGWVARGSGHLLVTASAAGLLTNLGDAPYSVTKHAAVALAEWLAITHGAQGVGVSCLCPQGVRTPLLFGPEADDLPGRPEDPWTYADFDASLAARTVTDQRILEPDDVAHVVFAALAEGRFLVLPHEEVAGYEQFRAADHDRWIAAMRKLQARLGPS